MNVHPIEAQSFRILEAEVDLGAWAGPERTVVARMVHATADESFAETARIGEAAVGAAVEALRAGGPVICDARMVAAGLTKIDRVECFLDQVEAGPGGWPTRSGRAVEAAAGAHPEGALWVVGNAPTALARLLELAAGGVVRPAAVIGLPVGYVGAAEAKQALWGSPLRAVSITNRGRRGGSPAAAAAVNALARLAR